MDILLNNKRIPNVGLGCMGMSEFYGDVNDIQSLSTLALSYDTGYRHYDTADMYGIGHNETLLGKFIKSLGSKRENIHVASKVGIKRDINDKYNLILDGSREYIHKSCDATLKRLGTDYLDLYYLHRKDPNISLYESISAMKELITAGKIKSIGLCEVSSETLREAHKIHPIAAIQSEYSLWTRDVEDAVLPACYELGITLVAFSPMGRGFLTGAVTKDYITGTTGEKDFRAKLPRFNGSNYDKNIALVNELIKISDSINLKPSQIALSWILTNKSNILAIPGTKREKYLLENFESTNIILDDETIHKLNSLFTKDSVFGERYPTQILKKSNA